MVGGIMVPQPFALRGRIDMRNLETRIAEFRATHPLVDERFVREVLLPTGITFGLNRFSVGSREHQIIAVTAVLRHAPKAGKDYTGVGGLSREGEEKAASLGLAIPARHRLVDASSSSPRAIATLKLSRQVYEGKENVAKPTTLGALSALEFRGEHAGKEAQARLMEKFGGETQFFEAWLKGEVPETIMESAASVGARIARETVGAFNSLLRVAELTGMIIERVCTHDKPLAAFLDVLFAPFKETHKSFGDGSLPRDAEAAFFLHTLEKRVFALYRELIADVTGRVEQLVASK